ncbi:integration host factor subunit alpha [bacterium]|nr:integration host factor subunit alpha [bacterium]
MSITKVELTDLVYEAMGNSKTGFDKKFAGKLVDMFFEEMKSGLVNDGAIQLSGFGKFTVKEKQERKGRNPQTREALTISKRKVVTFHHSQVLKEKLNK